MAIPVNATTLAALADERVDWRFKGLPVSWTGRTGCRARGVVRLAALFQEDSIDLIRTFFSEPA